jgi:hypothetical protein
MQSMPGTPVRRAQWGAPLGLNSCGVADCRSPGPECTVDHRWRQPTVVSTVLLAAWAGLFYAVRFSGGVWDESGREPQQVPSHLLTTVGDFAAGAAVLITVLLWLLPRRRGWRAVRWWLVGLGCLAGVSPALVPLLSG